MRRQDCFDRMNAVKGNYQLALRTVNSLIRLAADNARNLRTYDLSLPQMRNLIVELHEVYFVRMFACFESSVRDYWRTSVRHTKPLTEQLISLIAARRGIPQSTLDAVQEIREVRNHLIHEEQDGKKGSIMDEARMNEANKFLNAYLARLPLQW